MGYTTKFSGQWDVFPPISIEHTNILCAFAEEAHDASFPGKYCQWVPNSSPGYESDGISWDGGEKFYEYVEWARYIVEHFLAPWGYKLNGTIIWQGEQVGDVGMLIMKDNVLEVIEGRARDESPTGKLPSERMIEILESNMGQPIEPGSFADRLGWEAALIAQVLDERLGRG